MRLLAGAHFKVSRGCVSRNAFRKNSLVVYFERGFGNSSVGTNVAHPECFFPRI